MPKKIYGKVPSKKFDGLRCIDPLFSLIDSYRVISDPMTSYWRLIKTITRTQLLTTYYNYYNIPINTSLLKYNDTGNTNIIKFILSNILKRSNYIIIGDYAFNYYIDNIMPDFEIKNIRDLEIITTTDLEKTSNNILNILYSKFNKKNIKMIKYNKFFQFLDYRNEIYFNNKKILTIYGNDNKCIIYNYDKKSKIYFAPYTLLILYYLINYFYNIIYNNKNKSKEILNLLVMLYKCRNKYFKTSKKSILDDSKFKEFTLDCIGDTTTTIRSNILNRMNKQNKRFFYTATGEKKNMKYDILDNISGDIIY